MQHKVQPTEEKCDPPDQKRAWTLSGDLSVSYKTAFWKESLKIAIREELQIEGYNFGTQDKRHVKDLEIGRVSRKPFNPTPVIAPIKRRRVEETVTSGILEKEPKTVSNRPISSREQTGRSNNIPVVSTLDKAKTVRVSH